MTNCAHCGRPITITSRNPNRRYCSPRCRVADWHTRNDRSHLVLPDEDDVANDVPNEVPNDVPNQNAVPAANGVQHCPHCREPLAVISVLVPAAAAHIPTPEVIT
ncbi:MAG: hypothetical protein J2O49_09495 [Sciscionella sp.]|nr:hypothetical protein [Sciscionella sp.]